MCRHGLCATFESVLMHWSPLDSPLRCNEILLVVGLLLFYENVHYIVLGHLGTSMSHR